MDEYIKQHADRPSQDTTTTFGTNSDESAWLAAFGKAPTFLSGSAADGAAANDIAAAQAATMAAWPSQAAPPIAAPEAPLDFATFSAKAMEAAQQMAMANVQQMMMTQMIAAQAAEAESATKAAAVAAEEEARLVTTGAAKLGMSLRDKMMASRKRQAEALQDFSPSFTFMPGKFGVIADKESGIVQRIVEGGQAEHLGVKVGMRLLRIDGADYSANLLAAKIQGDIPYSVVLEAPKAESC